MVAFGYKGPLWVGSGSQQITVTYDVAIDWTILQTDLCSNCRNAGFTTSASSSFAKTSNTLQTTTNDKVSVKGYWSKDKVSVNPSAGQTVN
jgi:hypothetical protein